MTKMLQFSSLWIANVYQYEDSKKCMERISTIAYTQFCELLKFLGNISTIYVKYSPAIKHTLHYSASDLYSHTALYLAMTYMVSKARRRSSATGNLKDLQIVLHFSWGSNPHLHKYKMKWKNVLHVVCLHRFNNMEAKCIFRMHVFVNTEII